MGKKKPSPGKRSCKDRLQELRKEFGISKKDYTRAGKEAVSGKLPSREKMRTFVIAESKDLADTLAESRHIENYEPILREKHDESLLSKKGKKLLKKQQKAQKKSKEWYTNDVWQDSDGVYHNCAPGKVIQDELKQEMNRLKKKQKFRIAKYWLFDYLSTSESEALQWEYRDKDVIELVHECVIQYYLYKEAFLLPNASAISFEEWAEQRAEEEAFEEIQKREWPAGADPNITGTPIVYIDEDGDIPYFYEKEYEDYCKKHPVKKHGDAKKRKKAFIRKMNRRYREAYGGLHPGEKAIGDTMDQIFVAAGPNASVKDLTRQMQRIVKENAKRVAELEKEMKKYFYTNRPDETDVELEDYLESIGKHEFAERIRKSAEKAMKNQKKIFQKRFVATGMTKDEFTRLYESID